MRNERTGGMRCGVREMVPVEGGAQLLQQANKAPKRNRNLQQIVREEATFHFLLAAFKSTFWTTSYSNF